jgi:hypothetical protein
MKTTGDLIYLLSHIILMRLTAKFHVFVDI